MEEIELKAAGINPSEARKKLKKLGAEFKGRFTDLCSLPLLRQTL